MNHLTESTSFLTQGPFNSADVKSRPKSVIVRPRSFVDSRPYLFQRSTTTYGQFPPLSNALTRRRSAKQGLCRPFIMPRSHVSVARFYDWSEDVGDRFSVSKLYREIAKIPRPSKEKMKKLTSQVTSSGNINLAPLSLNSGRHYSVNPGRMFIRDKKALTRGEKEIIEGIYKNRGDVSSRDAIVKSEFQVTSHQDAWYAGKLMCDSSAFGRTLLKGERIDGNQARSCCHLETERSLTSSVSESSRHEETIVFKPSISTEALNPISRSSGQRFKPPNERNPCSVCQAQRETQHIIKRSLQFQNQESYRDESPFAPPSTPDSLLTQQPPTYDKLLGNRTSLPPNSILLAEKIRVYSDTNSQCNTLQNLDSRLATDITAIATVNQSNGMTSISKTENEPSDIASGTKQEIFSDTGSVLGSATAIPPSVHPSHDSDCDRKKFRVKVFVPTAELSIIEDVRNSYHAMEDVPVGDSTMEDECDSTMEDERDSNYVMVDEKSAMVSTGLSLSKERPLSHTEFKVSNTKKTRNNYV